MSTTTFKVIKKAEVLIEVLHEITFNFPNKYLELKREILRNGYLIIEIIHMANIIPNNNNESGTKIADEVRCIIGRIKIIGTLVYEAYKVKAIGERQYAKTGRSLNDLEKYTKGWYNYLIKNI